MPRHRRPNIRSAAGPIVLIGLLFFAGVSAGAQELPDEIRGYKVHRTKKVTVRSEPGAEKKAERDQDDLRVEVDFSEPELAGVGLFGITLELDVRVTVFGQSGEIDFITFRDFRVNGIGVEIEEYRAGFEFKKGRTVELEEPVRIFVSTPGTLRGALEDLRDSKEEWPVTGRVFVFGKFRKLGFRFKRVVPVDVDLRIKNPLREPEPDN